MNLNTDEKRFNSTNQKWVYIKVFRLSLNFFLSLLYFISFRFLVSFDFTGVQKIVPRLGLGFGLALALGLGGGAIFLWGNCPRFVFICGKQGDFHMQLKC